MPGTFNSIFVVICFFILISCSKKKDEEKYTPIVQERILKNLDSIYLLAYQIYLWNDQLEPIGHFNPSRFFNAELDEIMVYKNEIFEITRYAKNNVTKELFEFNPFSPGLPKYSDIMFIKGLNNYISVYTKDQHIITYMNLKEIINLIPAQLFCRVHRSYIVSFNYIKFIDGNSLFIDEEKIPINESYKATFYSRLKEFR